MACTVGITTDPDRRRAEHQRRYPNMSGWTLLSRHNTKTAAQTEETRVANRDGCHSYHGGGRLEYATWYVYKFYH